jgi:hypothetical protein
MKGNPLNQPSPMRSALIGAVLGAVVALLAQYVLSGRHGPSIESSDPGPLIALRVLGGSRPDQASYSKFCVLNETNDVSGFSYVVSTYSTLVPIQQIGTYPAQSGILVYEGTGSSTIPLAILYAKDTATMTTEPPYTGTGQTVFHNCPQTVQQQRAPGDSVP